MSDVIIKKLKLQNFCKFEDLELDFNNNKNILIGDNESGKSTILMALDLVMSGSSYKVDNIGLHNIFNVDSIKRFMGKSDRTISDLPKLYIEIYLNKQEKDILEGKNNLLDKNLYGLAMVVTINDDFSTEVSEIISQDEFAFPFEYYTVKFLTFAGEGYSGKNRHVKHILLDTTKINGDYSTKINGDYSTKKYVERLYDSTVDSNERNKHENEYKKLRQDFSNDALSNLNGKLTDYKFSLNNYARSSLLADLTLSENNVDIRSKGMGTQCFIKAKFALEKKEETGKEIDITLIEEPENHLSHVNTKKLLETINNSGDKQLFITTHSNLITSRLGLKNLIMLNPSNNKTTLLNDLPDDTANFFLKAPNQNLLNFLLSKKVILVEGNVEYMLMEKFFQQITNSTLEEKDVFVISVGGLSFSRYLYVAQKMNIKTAVIRDNDTNYQNNCVDRYTEFVSDNIKIFSDPNNCNYTFEVCFKNDNIDLCKSISKKDSDDDVLNFMLSKKTEFALEVLETLEKIKIPDYIKEAINWIKD